MPITGSQKALMYAQSNVERCGATRTGYHSPKLFLSVGGTHRATGKATASHVVEDLQISETANATPNRATFVAKGWEPTAGMEVIATLGSKNTLRRLFAGTVLSVNETAIGAPSARVLSVQCVDWTWALNRRKVFGHYTGTATAIALALMAAYAPSGFTTTNVQTGLDTIEGGITFTNVDLSVALGLLAKRARLAGGDTPAKAFITYSKDLYFRVTKPADVTNPTTLVASLTTLQQRTFKIDRDLSQVFTRVSMEGGGSTAAAEVAVGETIIPLQDAPATWYGDVGGVVLSGPQKITYTARVAGGGGGGLVGPGAAPSARPTVTGEWGTALTNNSAYQYAYTFVTAAGESLPSPVANITTGAAAPPPTASFPVASVNGTPIFGTGVYVYGISWQFPGTLRTTIGSLEQVLTNAANTASISLTSIPQPADAEATHINIWRSTLDGYTGIASLKLVATIAVGTTTYSDTTLDGALGAAAHTVATAVCREVRLTNVPAGPTGTTSRRLYRTAGGAAQLKLLTTLADNTTATFEDDIVDGSLGANAPLTDTSGLTQPTGQVAAGATSIQVAGGDFPSTGWAIAGSHYIRYTGRSASSLTGVPATGSGSLPSPLGYNTTIAPAPQLTGVTGILYTIPKGQDVNCFVTVDDLLAQSTLATQLGTADGVKEAVLQDRRLSMEEAEARAQAYLDLRAYSRDTVGYRSKDMNHRVGPQIVVNLAAPTSVADTFEIQTVTITNFTPGLAPDYVVSASNELNSVEDLLAMEP